MAEVGLEDVTKVYADGTVAVDDLDLEIDDGEFVVLVGPSGCGKTTALRMVAGLEEITDGEIRIGDRTVNRVPPRDRDIAMVFQNYALLSPPHRRREHGLRTEAPPRPQGRDQAPGRRGRPDPGARGAPRSPAALSGGQRSGWRWAGPSCGSPRPS